MRIAARAWRSRRQAAILAIILASASAAPLTAARAQGVRHDTGLPIEITADSLEVVQDQKIATFRGNVDATQGDMVLSADELRVHYRDDDDGATDPAATGAIRRIEAEGNVFLSSPEETAQGASGVYDVVANHVTIEGAVVLTRDDNVIRGDRLEIDLVSGRSQIFAAVPSTEGGTAPQRVRALFTPDDSIRPSARPADQSAAAAEGSTE
ncbi:MAG TPA: LptA/OstA family protein [Geminicoccaceae bacterium]|nr:LptA/OstA family protein [Geminicoccaceae bacterium]